MQFYTEIIARYAETDQMGVVHHSVYPVWYEVARTEFIKEFGYTYSQIEDMGLMLPLRELNCKYLLPAKYEDKIKITVELGKIGGAKMSFIYKLYNQDGFLLNEGITIHAWTDKNFKPVALKKHAPKLYEALTNPK